MADDMTCPHGRLPGSCEDCAYEDAKAAGLPLGGPPPAATRKRAEESAEAADSDASTSSTRRSRRRKSDSSDVPGVA